MTEQMTSNTKNELEFALKAAMLDEQLANEIKQAALQSKEALAAIITPEAIIEMLRKAQEVRGETLGKLRNEHEFRNKFERALIEQTYRALVFIG